MFRFRAIVRVTNSTGVRSLHATKNVRHQASVTSSLGRRTSSLLVPSATPRVHQQLVHKIGLSVRSFATTVMDDNDLKKRLDDFQDLFVEARLTIEDCTDSAGTKYFDEEAEAAQEAVNEAVTAFQSLIGDLEDEDQKNRVLRGNGLKVEQLKGEMQMALHGGHDH